MAQEERLREILLELQVLRDRESKSLAATKTLLGCLEAYTETSEPEAALQSIFTSLRTNAGAQLCLIVAPTQNSTSEVVASSDPQFLGKTLTPPINPFKRARNISRIQQLGSWGDVLDATEFENAALCPVQGDFAIMCFKSGSDPFAKSEMDLVNRLAGLALQAYKNANLSREKELLSAAIAGSSSGIVIADVNQDHLPLVYVNQAFEHISGFTSAEVLGKNCRFLSDEPTHSPERSRLRATIEARSAGKFLLRNRRKSGEGFWNELSLFPVYDPAGNPSHLVATQSDVTPRIESGQALDRVRTRMEQALAATDDAFLILDADGTVALANVAIKEMFPAPGVEWASGTSFDQNWSNYMEETQDLPGRATKLLKDADLGALSAVPGGQELDLPDGQIVLVRAAKLEDGGLVVSATDVTAMKSAQTLLAQRLAAMEAAPDGIAVADKGGRLTYLNSAATRLMGYDAPTSAFGRTWWHRYKDQGELQSMPAFDATLAQLNLPGAHHHEITMSPLDTGGSVIAIRDVSEKLATEQREEELTRDLVRLQRQEAVAQVTAGIAHDFNNYLAAINGSATLIDMESDLSETTRGHVKRIASAGAQSARLVNQLLDIGAGTNSQTSFDLASVLADLPAMVTAVLPGHARFEIRQGPSGDALKGDPSALSQVLLNLILNAGDALPKTGGTVTVEIAQQDPALSPPQVGALQPGADYLLLNVSDNGHGMDQATQDQVFQPYFTTKGHQGTGLGMAMVAAQAKSVGGAIGITSQVSIGTTIHLYWPLAQSNLAQPSQSDQTQADLTGLNLIVVDDDIRVGEVITKFLEGHGAEVALCEDPVDALEAIEENPEFWSALITDYDMPAMTGGELAHRIHGFAPSLPIFVVTALARRLNDPRLAQSNIAAILPKPVDLVALGQGLSEAVTPNQKD